MKTSTRQINIFLIHAHRDKEIVFKLYHRMVRDGIHAWLDSQNLQPGQDWQHEIRKAILKSDVVVVCLTRGFNEQQGYRHEELKIALSKANSLPERQSFIIPARLEACDLPESLRRWQRVDLFESRGYRKLADALQQYSKSS